MIAQEEARHRAALTQIALKYQMEKNDEDEILNLLDAVYKEWNRIQLDMVGFSRFFREVLGEDYECILNLYCNFQRDKQNFLVQKNSMVL